MSGGLAYLGLSADAATSAPPVSAHTAAGAGTTSMKVTWPAQSGAKNYRVKWSLTKDMANLSRVDVGTATSTTLTGLATNTDYYVTVNVNSPKALPNIAGVKLTPAPPVCTLSTRGIPSAASCAVVGSSTGRASTETVEAAYGRNLGVHRTYYQANGADAAVAAAKDDAAHHRIPWVSFKLPYTWTDMAAGKGDAWAKDIATKMKAVPGPVWIAFHHEPEHDQANIADWTAMQARLAPIVRAEAPNVAYTVIVTGWTVTHQADFSLDKIMPVGAPIDVLGFDKYDSQGTFTNGKEGLTPTDMKAEVYDPIGGWAKAHGMAWGVAETGMTDKAASLDPTWMQRSFDQLKAAGGSAFTYFDSEPGGDQQWSLKTTEKQSQFKALLGGTPSF